MRSVYLSTVQSWSSRFSIMASILVLVFCVSTNAAGQAHEETLPALALFNPGSGVTNLPFNTSNDSTVLMVYDHVTSPVRINEIYFRAIGNGSNIANFSFSDVEITLFHASEEFNNLHSTFANNIQSGYVVRKGPYLKNFDIAENSAAGRTGWIPLQLQKGFTFDPDRGQLGILIRVCGVNTPWGLSIDGENGFNAGT